jgi:Domain of unknown function (DUF4442)
MTLNSTDTRVNGLITKFNQNWRVWFFFLLKLPSAWFWGMKIKSVDHDKGVVSLPYTWFSKNPFRSIYFAAQTGAAELSTGLLGFIAIEDKPPMSMLITSVAAEFVKKADSLTTFTCDEGGKIRETVELAIKTGKGQAVTVTSIGVDNYGDVVSRFKFTWSFKLKSS